MEVQGLGRFLYRVGRVAFHAPPTILPRLFGGAHQIAGVIEFSQQAVGSFAWGHQSPAFAVALGVIFAPGNIMRISFIGIMGRKRTNNRKSAVNRPSVPT